MKDFINVITGDGMSLDIIGMNATSIKVLIMFHAEVKSPVNDPEAILAAIAI